MISISRNDINRAYMADIFFEDIGLYPIFDDWYFQCNTSKGELIIPIPKDILKDGNRDFCISDKMGCPLPEKAKRIIKRAKKEYSKYELTDILKARKIIIKARIAFIKALSDAIMEGYTMNYWKNGKIEY